MKITEIKQVGRAVNLTSMENAITAFNTIVESRACLSDSGHNVWGTRVYTKGDKLIRVNNYAAQINTLVITCKIDSSVHPIASDRDWYDQFNTNAENNGYTYSERHVHVDYLGDRDDSKPETLKSSMSYAVVNNKRVDSSEDICKLCSKWSLCSYSDGRCDILS